MRKKMRNFLIKEEMVLGVEHDGMRFFGGHATYTEKLKYTRANPDVNVLFHRKVPTPE